MHANMNLRKYARPKNGLYNKPCTIIITIPALLNTYAKRVGYNTSSIKAFPKAMVNILATIAYFCPHRQILRSLIFARFWREFGTDTFVFLMIIIHTYINNIPISFKPFIMVLIIALFSCF